MTTDPIEQLRQLESALELALRAEGVPRAARERVVSRVLFGEPDAPHRIRRYRTLSWPAANKFFDAWANARASITAEPPHPLEPPPCPGCSEPAVIVTGGAVLPGWFEVRPCGCLFDVDPKEPSRFVPEYTYGTPVAPTAFLPMEVPPPLPAAFRRDGQRRSRP